MSPEVDEKVVNLQIRQTWINEQLDQIIQHYGYKGIGDAFEAFVISLIFDMDYLSIQPDEIVDGGQDKQIDIVRIEDNEDQGIANIYIIQTKRESGFSSNTVIDIRNGLNWIFVRPREEYQQLDNPNLINKIEEIMQLRLDYGASNLNVYVYYVTVGDTRVLSEEYIQEKKILIDTYGNIGFSLFEYREIGAFELIDQLNENERADRRIDLDIPIVYDVNRPSVIQCETGDTEAIICTIKGSELAKISQKEPRDAIFDMNVRPYYGSRGQVNNEILLTCTGEESSRFWFLNNGITMVCEHLDLVPDPDTPIIKVKNAQIINGCQTTVTLREAFEQNGLKEDVKVLLKAYSTDNPNLSERITLTTNNQNRITDRDLRANDAVQIDIQRMILEKFGLFYERKNRQYRGFRGEQKTKILPNYRVAQAYLSVVRRKPSVARGYLGKIWSDYYREIFENATIEDLVLSFLIYQYCARQALIRYEDPKTLDYEVAVYGTFHISRVTGRLITNDEWGPKYIEQNKKLIATLSSEILEQNYKKGHSTILKIRRKSVDDEPNPALYFKANEIHKFIEKEIGKL